MAMTTQDKRNVHVVEDENSAIDYCFEQGWTDGLPVVPPSEERVEAMLEATPKGREKALATHPATGRSCSVYSAAVNAVMAGCRPDYFPVVVAALEAMNEPGYNFHGSCASTGGSAPLLVMSGPICERLGMNSGVNVFGPGARANATIGRAIRLIILNVFRMIPGVTDRSTQGNPGKYSMCIAENGADKTWEPLNVSLGFAPEVSTVTVFAAAGFHNVENHYSRTAEGILLTMTDAMSTLASITRGESVVVMAPEHTQFIAKEGLTRAQVQEFLYRHTHRKLSELKRVGKFEGKVAPEDEQNEFHRGFGPEDILLVAAGGEAGGHSAFLPSWSRARASLMQTKPIEVV